MSTGKALALFVATACLLTSAFGRPSIQTSNSRRRSLLAENQFDVTVTSNAQGGSTSSITPLFTINFGRALVQKNPLGLFTIDGADRVDVVYSKDTGMLWVLSFVENKDQPGKVSLYVDSGVATAADGGATNIPASVSVDYIPSATSVAAGNAVNGTNSSSTFATAASWGVAGSLAVSFGAAVLSPSGVVGVGAINFAGFAQTFAMSGSLPITNMPLNYKSAASSMEWVALQPKVGPANPAPTEEEKQQAAELADTSARFPYTPVEVKILPDGSFDASTNTGDGQTGEVVSVPVSSNATDTTPEGGDASASTGSDGSSTDGSTNSTTTKPVSVVVVPLPEQDLVSSNGTKPSPFKPAAAPAPIPEEDSGIITVPASAPNTQQPSGGTVNVESTTPPSGGIVIGAPAPPAPVAQQGGVDSGIVIETPNTPPTGGNGSGSVTDDTVVVILPGDNATQNPPPSSKKNTPPPVPTNSSSNSGGGAPQPTPGPPGSNTTSGSGSGSGSAPPPQGDKNIGSGPPPSGNNDKTPPVPMPPSLIGGGIINGTAQQEADESNGVTIDIPGAKVPATAPTPAPTPSKSPAPAPSSKSPSTSTKSPPPAVTKSPPPVPKSPPPSPSPSPSPSPPPPVHEAPTVVKDAADELKPVDVGEKKKNPSASSGAKGDDGPRVKPLPNNNNKGKPQARTAGRHLLLNDPLAALSSSGFSYVVVTATADGSGGATVNGTDAAAGGETIGASALSRIRTIQNAGQGPDADAHRLNSLWDVLFWTAIAVVATFILHVCVLGLLRWAKKPVPKMLHLPRMELLVFMMTLPMIAAAGAGLLKSTNGGIVALGVFFSVLLPFGFLGVASVFLVKYLLQSAVEQRRALYVLVATQDAHSELDAQLFNGGRGAISSLGSSPEGSLTAAMLGPEARDSLAALSSAEFGVGSGGASGSGTAGASTSRASTAAPASTQQTAPSFLKKAKSAVYKWVLRPVFGFQDSSAHAEALAITDGAAWLGRGKWDAEFVKRYGCFFEDTHGPQVLRVRSRYDPISGGSFNSTAGEDVVGSGVLVPATSTGAAEGAMQALQTFGIVFAVTKMVLFAVIINGPGGVNNIGQVMALLLVALMHVVYLRLCHPYRLRIELAAEMVASTCDLAIFACGIALIAKPEWTSSERHNMGIAMLVLQAVGFLIFITVRVGLALRTLGKTVGPAVKHLWPKKLTFGTSAAAHTPSDAQFLASTSAAATASR